VALRRKYSRPMLKRDSQCACNVTMRPVHATVVALEKQLRIKPTYSECVYPACTAHAPYFHLWSVRLYGNFFRIISQQARFSEKKNI